jgi:hypothetical protein
MERVQVDFLAKSTLGIAFEVRDLYTFVDCVSTNWLTLIWKENTSEEEQWAKIHKHYQIICPSWSIFNEHLHYGFAKSAQYLLMRLHRLQHTIGEIHAILRDTETTGKITTLKNILKKQINNNDINNNNEFNNRNNKWRAK